MRDAQVLKILLVFLSYRDDFFVFRKCIILTLASLIGISFVFGMFPGNESVRIKVASPFSVC